MELKYIGTYKVVRIYQKSGKSQLIEKDLSLEDAKKLVNSFSEYFLAIFSKKYLSDRPRNVLYLILGIPNLAKL